MSKRPAKIRLSQPAAPLRMEIATTRDGRDITAPYVMDLVESRDPLLSGAIDWGQYDEILRDDQVFATLQQRLGAVIARDWEVIPGNDDDPRAEEAAEAFNEQVKSVGWDNITRKMLMGVFYGYAVAEMGWGGTAAAWSWDWIKVRHARRFRWGKDGDLRLLTRQNMRGEALPDRKFWVHTAGGQHDDEPYGLGLAHWLYWPVLFKRNGLKFWNIFLDKFGSPTAKGTYPRGSSDQDRRNLLAALQAIAQDTGFIVPEGMQVELLSAARSGVGDFKELCAYMDAAIAKIVLSQTMTTDNGSSRAQGEVHAEVKLEVIKSDADLLTDSFTKGPARWWTDFNYGADVAAPIVRRVVEEETDLKATAETDAAHAANGWVRTEDSFRETYGEGFVRRDDGDAPSGSEASPPVIVTSAPANDRAPATDPDDLKPAPPRKASFAGDDPRPLYVYRRLLNASELLAWAQAQGFAATLSPDDLHATITYSRRPVNWWSMAAYPSDADLIVGPGGPRMVERMGDGSAVALLFQDSAFQWRHKEMVEGGASWDWPSYIPHVTLSYDVGEMDLAAIEPYQGRLIFGPEIFEAIDENWRGRDGAVSSFAESTVAPDDAESITDRMIAQEGAEVAAAMTGDLIARVIAAEDEAAARAILATALETMDDAPLVKALERAGFAAQLAAATSASTTGRLS